MWVIVAVIHGRARAENAVNILKSEGFLVKTTSLSKKKKGSEEFVQLSVLACEADEAKEILLINGF